MQWHRLSLKSKLEESVNPKQPYPPHKCDLGSDYTQCRLPQPSLSGGNLSTERVGFVSQKRANLEISLSGAVATQQTYQAFVGWVSLGYNRFQTASTPGSDSSICRCC